MVVLRNSPGCGARCLFLPGKTRRTSELKLGNVQAVLVPMKLGQLRPISSMHYSHDIAERHSMSSITDPPDGHKRPRDRRDLEDRLDVLLGRIVREIELALTKVGNRSTISHEKLLASQAAGRWLKSISSTVVK